MVDSSACVCDGSAGSTARYTCVQSARVPPWLPTWAMQHNSQLGDVQ